MKSLKLIRGNNISVSKERSCTSYVHNDAAPHETRCYNVKKKKAETSLEKLAGRAIAYYVVTLQKTLTQTKQ